MICIISICVCVYIYIYIYIYIWNKVSWQWLNEIVHEKPQVPCLSVSGSCFYYGVRPAGSTKAAGLPSAQSPLQATWCGRAGVWKLAPLSHSPLPFLIGSFCQTRLLLVFSCFSFSAVILLGSQPLQTRVLCQMWVSTHIRQGSFGCKWQKPLKLA